MVRIVDQGIMDEIYLIGPNISLVLEVVVLFQVVENGHIVGVDLLVTIPSIHFYLADMVEIQEGLYQPIALKD